jgi:hypothetical protein
VMGLCLGDYESSNVPNSVPHSVFISQIYLLRRRQKAADRVEVSDKDLAEASHYAESIHVRPYSPLYAPPCLPNR